MTHEEFLKACAYAQERNLTVDIYCEENETGCHIQASFFAPREAYAEVVPSGQRDLFDPA